MSQNRKHQRRYRLIQRRYAIHSEIFPGGGIDTVESRLSALENKIDLLETRNYFDSNEFRMYSSLNMTSVSAEEGRSFPTEETELLNIQGTGALLSFSVKWGAGIKIFIDDEQIFNLYTNTPTSNISYNMGGWSGTLNASGYDDNTVQRIYNLKSFTTGSRFASKSAQYTTFVFPFKRSLVVRTYFGNGLTLNDNTKAQITYVLINGGAAV